MDAGRYDLILQPTNLWLTIHESIGHPTELDRAMGYEANFAGTSFVAPPEKMIGKLKYGPPIMNIQCDRTQEQSLGSRAWDDEGVPADKWLIIEKGIFKDYQTTREQAAWIPKLTGVKRVARLLVRRLVGQVQFQRMPNVSLLPGDKDIDAQRHRRGDRPRHRRSRIAARGRSITSATTSQFSGQAFYEVQGRQDRRNAARTSRTKRTRRCSGTRWT